MDEPLVETWMIHDRINRYLLDAVPDDALDRTLGPRHRSVAALFAHLHNVRMLWLRSSAPRLKEGLPKLDPKTTDRAALVGALEGSGQAIAELVRQSLASGGQVKGFRPHVTAFVGYLIAHESHHRGQIGWTLKRTGTPLDPKISYGLWDWGVR